MRERAVAGIARPNERSSASTMSAQQQEELISFLNHFRPLETDRRDLNQGRSRFRLGIEISDPEDIISAV